MDRLLGFVSGAAVALCVVVAVTADAREFQSPRFNGGPLTGDTVIEDGGTFLIRGATDVTKDFCFGFDTGGGVWDDDNFCITNGPSGMLRFTSINNGVKFEISNTRAEAYVVVDVNNGITNSSGTEVEITDGLTVTGDLVQAGLAESDLTAGACTAGEWHLDTGGATRELCHCNAAGSAYDCWSATTANGPTD